MTRFRTLKVVLEETTLEEDVDGKVYEHKRLIDEQIVDEYECTDVSDLALDRLVYLLHSHLLVDGGGEFHIE